MQILFENDFLCMPWKNGQGTTLELFKLKKNFSEDSGFIFRLSKAFIKNDNDFSLFPGIDRTLILLKGDGVILNIRDHEQKLSLPYSKIQFRGEDRVSCKLINSPCEDFNIMVERQYAKVEHEICYDSKELFSSQHMGLFLYYVSLNKLLILEKSESLKINPERDGVIIVTKLFITN